MGKMISVIVPVYNSEEFLEKCINSILSQRYKNFELILINDGSIDKSGEICKKYDDTRVRYFEHENKGVSYTRNIGIKESSGELITFVDSDDELSDDYLLILEGLHRKNDTDLTMCTFTSVDDKGQNVDLYKSEWDNNLIIRGDGARKELTEKVLSNTGNNRPVMSPYCKLYRTSIIRENKIYFDEKLPIGEDALFNLQYAQYINSFLFINKVLYFRTIREGSAVMSCRPQIYKELRRLFEHYLIIKKRYKIKPKSEKMFFFNKLNDSLGLYVFRSKNIKEFHYRVGKMYNFLKTEPMASVWSATSAEDISGKKDKLKYFFIRSRMVGLWSLFRKK